MIEEEEKDVAVITSKTAPIDKNLKDAIVDG
jgi:hypothetical protein